MKNKYEENLDNRSKSVINPLGKGMANKLYETLYKLYMNHDFSFIEKEIIGKVIEIESGNYVEGKEYPDNKDLTVDAIYKRFKLWSKYLIPDKAPKGKYINFNINLYCYSFTSEQLLINFLMNLLTFIPTSDKFEELEKVYISKEFFSNLSKDKFISKDTNLLKMIIITTLCGENYVEKLKEENRKLDTKLAILSDKRIISNKNKAFFETEGNYRLIEILENHAYLLNYMLYGFPLRQPLNKKEYVFVDMHSQKFDRYITASRNLQLYMKSFIQLVSEDCLYHSEEYANELLKCINKFDIEEIDGTAVEATNIYKDFYSFLHFKSMKENYLIMKNAVQDVINDIYAIDYGYIKSYLNGHIPKNCVISEDNEYDEYDEYIDFFMNLVKNHNSKIGKHTLYNLVKRASNAENKHNPEIFIITLCFRIIMESDDIEQLKQIMNVYLAFFNVFIEKIFYETKKIDMFNYDMSIVFQRVIKLYKYIIKFIRTHKFI